MCTCTYRSPGGPPFTPGSPSPVRRTRSPSSTPDGIFTDSVFCSLTRPLPLQVLQGVGITLPLPWHRGQVCAIENGPCETRTWPAPRHDGQVVGCVPGFAPLPLQFSHTEVPGRRILVSKP